MTTHPTSDLDHEVATVHTYDDDHVRIAVDHTAGAAHVIAGRPGTDPVELNPHAALIVAEALRQAATIALDR